MTYDIYLVKDYDGGERNDLYLYDIAKDINYVYRLASEWNEDLSDGREFEVRINEDDSI